jgi:hypothetical protein
MKTPLVHLCSAIVLAGLFTTSLSMGKDKESTEKMDPKMAEMMKKAEALGAPGAAHKLLEPLVGKWTAEVQCWMTPGGPPTASKGTAKTEWAMNGRFIKEEFKGEMMGKPFVGMMLTGYDNHKKQYSTLWVDDMSTAMLKSEGTADADGKVFTFLTKMDCPMTGEKDMPIRQVIRIVNADTHVFEMHETREGKEERKTMEITYTRK